MGIEVLLEMTVTADPERVAVRDRDNELTASELRRLAEAVAAHITTIGARSVAFLGVNSVGVPAALFGAVMAGVPFTPLNYRLAPDALQTLLGRLDAPLLVTDSSNLSNLQTLPSSSELWNVLNVKQLTGLTLPSDSTAPPVSIADDSTAVMLFTSGTTSAPKGVLLSHRQLTSYILQTVDFGGAAGQTALVCLPPYHVAGVGAILSNIYSGRCLSYLADFSPDAWLTKVREEQVTSAMVVPTMLASIVEMLDGNPADTPSLTSLAYGGARMPLPVLRKAMEAFPDTGFTNAYGLTETSSTISVLGPEDHRSALQAEDHLIRQRLGSVGRFVPGVEGQIRNPHGAVLGPGEVGALWVRGSQISGAYAGSGSTLDEDGWFSTRDDGWLDDNGFLYLTGRTDDTIIRGGENIAPDEIEQIIINHSDVSDVAVFGAPDQHWGERTVAAVVLREGAACSEEQLREWVRGRARSSRTPDVIIFVDDLPYSPTGKLLRRELRGSNYGAKARAATAQPSM